jgi:hypothetical protein
MSSRSRLCNSAGICVYKLNPLPSWPTLPPADTGTDENDKRAEEPYMLPMPMKLIG